MKVAKLMTRKLFTVSPEDTVDTAVQYLRQRGVRHLLVLDQAELVGILSDRDIKRALQPEQTKRKKVLGIGGLYFLLEPILVREIMTSAVIYVRADQSTDECMALMTRHRLRHLPVMNGDDLIGMLSIGDLVNDIISEQRFTIEQLEHYIHGGSR